MFVPLRVTVVFTDVVRPRPRGPCDPCVHVSHTDALYVVNGVVWGRPGQAGARGAAAHRRLAGLAPAAITRVEVIRDPATLRTYGVRQGAIVSITTTEP
jgi:hypothetical protein